MKPKGLGDTIEKFTTMTGIKRLADSIPGGCGCDDRKDWFNKNFPYKKIKGPHVFQHDLLYLRCLFLPSYQ